MENGTAAVPDELRKVAQAYVEFRKKMRLLKKEKELVKINKTFAGYFAKKMEFITKPLGFDYRVNIALIGGFAAKEVILSTLGTAYSIGSEKEELSLSERLRNDPTWNKGKAFALMVFIMLYVPCMATVASIVKETSWRWAIFSVCFNLLYAYTISFAVLNLSRLL
jgi:ferrous iron transport protein B